MINRWFTATISFAILLLLFFPALSWRFQNFVRYGFRRDSGSSENLRAENIQLKSDLAKLENISRVLPNPAVEFVPAFVYSQYPLPFKNELILSAGGKQGVIKGASVIFSVSGGQAFMIGKISEVWPNHSSVQTIFDKRYKTAVRIGKNGTDSLLNGGTVPKLTLIPKAKPIEPGQVVYSASPDSPYGTAVGEVGVVTVIPETSMQEAELLVPYDPNSIHSVLVEKKDS